MTIIRDSRYRSVHGQPRGRHRYWFVELDERRLPWDRFVVEGTFTEARQFVRRRYAHRDYDTVLELQS